MRELDDAVALGLGARARGERLAWLQPAWATRRARRSRSRGCSRASSRPAGCSRSATRSRSRRTSPRCSAPASSSSASISPSGTSTGWSASTATSARCRFPDDSFDQVLLVSTLEHVGADNTVYGLAAEDDPASRGDALRELASRAAAAGQPARHRAAGRARRPRLVPARRRRRLEQPLRGGRALRRGAGGVRADDDGWRAAPAFHAAGVGYGDRGPAASAVLCSELSPRTAAAAADARRR